ncbi:phytoene/squalene synthase family protein [Profundibacter sp.]
MSLSYCAKLLKDADEDRFLSAMAAKPDMRAVLFPLYAFNVEVSKAAWASGEPMLCQMRLQYLADMVAAIYTGNGLPNSPLAQPLADVVKQGGLPQHQLLEMIEARDWDVGRAGFGSAQHLHRYLDQTAGNLMLMAARLTGVSDHHYDAVRAHGYAMGLAKFLLAVPELKAHGRVPLPDETPDALARLARDARLGITDTRAVKIDGGQSALRAGWDTRRVLDLVCRAPERVLAGRLQTSPFRRKTSLLMISLFG